MGNGSPCPFLCLTERIYNVYLYTLSNSCVSCVSSLCSRSISYRITHSYQSSIFCHLEYVILYVILQKSPDLENRLASCYIEPYVRHFQIKTYVSDRYIPHASTRLHTNIEAISVIARLSIYYKENQLDSCGYVISYQL